MYRLVLKPFLFLLSAERAHYFTVSSLRLLLKIPILGKAISRSFSYRNPKLHRKLFDLEFSNPVGLAAGFDKDGRFYETMSAVGFGFIEIGTVTPRPQAGNPKPRLFRLPQDQGLINRMGFNNEGVDAMVEKLKKPRPDGLIIGGNIGKNKDTPNGKAADDYLLCFEKLFDYVDYFVVNVSSPNTPNLRDLQDKEPLTNLLTAIQQKNNSKPQPKPVLLKIAPDLTDGQLDDIIEIATNTKLAGLIATNTTISRDNLHTSATTLESIGNGGLSGSPLKDRSTAVIKYLHEKSSGTIPIIGVGGIASAEDAVEKLEAGASLIQVYSGMIYSGPTLVKNICKKLVE